MGTPKQSDYQTSQQKAEEYWLECIRKWYPKRESRTNFLPPLHFNRTSYRTQAIAGHRVSVPRSPQDSDVRDDRTQARVLLCLHALANNPHQRDNTQEGNNSQTDNFQQTNSIQTDNNQQADNTQTYNSQQTENPGHKEVMMVISQLQFGKYLGEPSYAAAVALLPRPRTLPAEFRQQHYDQGDFDVLIIHKELGLLTLEIKSVGENFKQLAMTEQEQDDVVMKKVEQALKQLNKAEVVLKHLTSDIPAITQITKILVLPNISSRRLLRVINRTPDHGKFLCECLGAKSVDDAMKLCLLKDQLSDNQTPSDVNHSSLQALREWWQHIRASRSGSSLTSSLYEQLVARFCGPATTVEVHRVTAPRLNIRTLGEAVSETGERVVRLVLFPQQVDILNQSPRQAFLSGPPGTGKTIVLIMQGLTWIQRGYNVHVVSTWNGSLAVTFVIEHQLQEKATTSTTLSPVHRHQFDFRKDGEVKTAVTRLKSQSEERLCVIADEVVPDMSGFNRKPRFTEFCDQLINEVPGVFIWGASVHRSVRPLCLPEVNMTTPLRSPPVVVREVMEAWEIKNKQVLDYTVSDVPVPTDGPPVMRIEHRDGQLGHTGTMTLECVQCGHEVARVLTEELNVGLTGESNDPPPLQYRNVLVLCHYYPTDDGVDSNGQVITASGLVQGLRDCHVPLRVLRFDDEAVIRDTALDVGDMVTVAYWDDFHGLERKVVVVENGLRGLDRLRSMSRCTSQLVVIDCLRV